MLHINRLVVIKKWLFLSLFSFLGSSRLQATSAHTVGVEWAWEGGGQRAAKVR